MKTILTAIFSILFFLQGFSQSLPINYQAVIRDNQGAILANEAVTLRFSLLQGSANGTALYLEEHQETTNQFGLVNIQFGTGLVLGGDFYQIDWSLMDYYLKLEIQNGNGQGFTDLGTSKFVAVPYANFALNAANVNNNDTSATNELQNLTINNNIINLDNNGGTVDLTPYLDNTDSQTLTRTGNQISISGGNNITLPTDQVFDGDSSVFNELQAISFANDTLTLSNGGKVYLGAYDNSQAILFNSQQIVSFNNKQKVDSAMFINLFQLNGNAISNNTNQILLLSQKVSTDSIFLQSQLNTHISNDSDLDSLNELQIISISNDTLYLSKGGYVVLPNDNVDDADNNPTNEIQVLNLSNDTLFLSGGGFVVLPSDEVNDNDADSTNEIQTLTLNGNSLSLSDANTINLPFDNDTSSINELQSISISNDTIYLNNGGFVVLPADEVNDLDSNPTNELQALNLSNDTLYLTNGGFVKLPADNVFDGDSSSTNELQFLGISNDTITLTDGGFIVLPQDLINDIDADTTNEVQTLSLDGKSLSISKGNSVLLPNDNDTSSLNEIQVLSISNDTINLSNGGFVVLPTDQVNDADSNPTNELQILSISNDSLKLSNGGFVDLTNYNNMQAVLGLYNKLKTDSATFSNLINTNSNNIALKGSQLDTTNQVLQNHLTNDLDVDTLNEIQALSISNDTLFLESGGFVDLSGFRDYNKLENKPDSLSDFVNDMGFLTNQNTSTYQIGDTAFGGIIYYVSPNGNRGRVVSLNDQGNGVDFHTAKTKIDDYNSVGLISDEFQDWMMPSIKDLELIWNNLGSLNFIDDVYWSKSDTLFYGFIANYFYMNFGQSVHSDIHAQFISQGQKGFTTTENRYNHSVRAIRHFGDEAILILENLDNDSTNEIQQLSISNDTISLSKSNYLKLPKDSFTVFQGGNGITVSNDVISRQQIPTRVSSSNDTLWIDGNWFLIPGISQSNNFGSPAPVTDIDGNIYPTVKIGNQIWMAEELKVSKLSNGTPITYGTPSNHSPYSYQTNNSFGRTIGYYSGYVAALDVCPIGWHVPSESDVIILKSNASYGAIKSTNTNNWNSPNTGATNSSGFNAFGSGYYSSSGNYSTINSYKQWGIFWTSNYHQNAGSTGLKTFYVRYDSSNFPISSASLDWQIPIRCIKD